MKKADLHVHSIYSTDAITKPETVLASAADHGIDFIAITDHDTIAGWQAFKAIESNYPVHVILGQEVKVYSGTRIAGELLCLFLNDKIRSNTIANVIAEVRAQNGLVSIAHPFSERQHEFKAFHEIDDLDSVAIETNNGRCFKARDNEMAQGLADQLGLPYTAGSDAHTPFEIGQVFLEFDGSNQQDLKAAILNRNVQTRGQASNALFTLLSGFGRLGMQV